MKVEDLVGQYCQRPDGERIFVQALMNPPFQGMPILAVGIHIEGENKGARTRNYVTSLKPLGREVPFEKPLA